MKKLFVLSAIFVLALAGKTFAKTGLNKNRELFIVMNSPDTTKPPAPKPSGDKPKDIAIELPSWSWGATDPSTGPQRVVLPDGRGILTFTISGNSRSGKDFLVFLFKPVRGEEQKLYPVQPGTNGTPKPACKYPLPDACFASADKSVGLCICKPDDLTAHPDGYVISMLLPAVQKVREAANQTSQQ